MEKDNILENEITEKKKATTKKTLPILQTK